MNLLSGANERFDPLLLTNEWIVFPLDAFRAIEYKFRKISS